MIPLPPVEEEQELTSLEDHGKEFFLHPAIAIAWQKMKRAAKSESIHLEIVSAFRSFARQNEIIENKRKKEIPDSEIFKVSAPAGFSEHHSGRAIDITTPGFDPLKEEFEDSEAFEWLSRRAIDFGFSLSYPRENQYGIAYEPWHWLHQGNAEPGS